jgi:signal peptidase I
MTRRNRLSTTPKGPAAPAGRPTSDGRESVETFVVVFLGFLVLGIEAEGFVIPTGSMAPTLMGRHKEVTCPQCGLVYSVDGVREVESPATGVGTSRIVGAVCVNCRFPARADDEPNFQGDRVYVMKTPLRLPSLPSAQLGRWDVTVFKLPEEPEVRYIKRLVGMPDEVLRIHRGDIWVKPQSDPGPFRRPFRPLKHQEAMQILVHDDVHRPRALASDPRWARWASRSSGGWEERPSEPGRYKASASPDGWAELRYRHVVPDPAQWAAVLEDRPLPHAPRSMLITDFYSYNTEMTEGPETYPMMAAKAWRQPHWVGDLTVGFLLDVGRRAGSVRVELVKAGVVNRCEIDLTTGQAQLLHDGRPLGPPAATGIDGPGRYRVSLANVDDRLTLRVDDRLPFGEGVVVEPPTHALAPTAADLDPVGVAARGADLDLTVSELKLTRDIYYTLQPGLCDLAWGSSAGDPLPTDPVALFDWLAEPANFAAFGNLGTRDFPIAKGRYMMLGDNSPWSRDGRDWKRTDQNDPDDPGRGWDDSGRQTWEVPEALLIGKAFCVYWPHLKPFGPTVRLGRDFRLPARPYVERMRWVR